MQNKPNFQKTKMKLNLYSTKDYENKSGLLKMEKQTQSNPTCTEQRRSVKPNL